MKTSLVKEEIKRFLKSSEPEVMSIRGKWGVGKTYTWKQYLTQINSEEIGLENYSYISLFGLNSLEALKYSVFENTVSTNKITESPNLITFGKNITDSGIKKIIMPFGSSVLNRLGLKDSSNALGRALFLSVKKQIICVDDLERAGSSLETRDVLGLASMLKEERDCKVVLLLNDEELEADKKKEFDLLLEKVIDVSLIFEPTADEATEIAFQENSVLQKRIKPKIIHLNIINIRIIKKIERLAIRLYEILRDRKEEVIEQAMSTVVIGTWSQLSPKDAPPFEIIKNYYRGVESVEKFETFPDEEKNNWRTVFNDYGYRYSDDFNHEIIKGIERGYFDSQSIESHADKLEHDIDNNKLDNSFTKAWEKYHGSLNMDDDEILDLLYNTALENLTIISISNINGTIKLLRECGKEELASHLVKRYFSENNFEENLLKDSMTIINESVDPEIESAFQKIEEQYVDNRDPIDVMKKIAKNRSWNPEDIELLSKLSADDYERIFLEIEDQNLNSIGRFIVARSNDDGDNNKRMKLALDEGLKRIAAKSYLRAERIKSYGVDL